MRRYSSILLAVVFLITLSVVPSKASPLVAPATDCYQFIDVDLTAPLGGTTSATITYQEYVNGNFVTILSQRTTIPSTRQWTPPNCGLFRIKVGFKTGSGTTQADVFFQEGFPPSEDPVVFYWYP